MAAEVELEELLAAILSGAPVGGLLRNGAEGAGAYLVVRVVEESFELGGREVDELLAELEDVAHAYAEEDVAHAYAEEDVALAVFAFVGLEIALDLAELVVRLEGGESADVLGGREVVGGGFRVHVVCPIVARRLEVVDL